jgi:hypothetical protein
LVLRLIHFFDWIFHVVRNYFMGIDHGIALLFLRLVHVNWSLRLGRLSRINSTEWTFLEFLFLLKLKIREFSWHLWGLAITFGSWSLVKEVRWHLFFRILGLFLIRQSWFHIWLRFNSLSRLLIALRELFQLVWKYGIVSLLRIVDERNISLNARRALLLLWRFLIQFNVIYGEWIWRFRTRGDIFQLFLLVHHILLFGCLIIVLGNRCWVNNKFVTLKLLLVLFRAFNNSFGPTNTFLIMAWLSIFILTKVLLLLFGHLMLSFLLLKFKQCMWLETNNRHLSLPLHL